MKRMIVRSIDLRGRPLEVGSVIRLNGKLCVVTGEIDGKSEISWKIEALE